jgi:hypothetical protein
MANPTAVRARIVPAAARPSVVLGDHDGWSAETGAAVGFAAIPVETSEAAAGVAAVTPVLISDAVAVRPAVAAVCCVPRPVLTSDAVI